MASPSLLALAERVVMLAWRRNASPATLSLYNGPVRSLQHWAGSAVESRQQQPDRFPPRPPPTSVLPTTTVLTVTTPGLATSLSALTSTGPTVSFSGPDTRPPSLASSSSVKPSSSEALVTDIMPTDISSPIAFPTTTDATANTRSPNGGGSGITGNKTLLITLSTVLSVVGLVLVVGGILLCRRCRNRRQTFFSRGITPIDDDEIATWKVPRDEKSGYHGGETDAEADAMFAKETFGKETGGPSHGKHASTSSVKKPPSVIVYDNFHGRGRQSTDEAVPRRSFTQHPVYGKMSFEKALPQTPIHARAPNARAGLTDESVPGDEPYIPSPGRQSSRLSKLPPNSASSRRGHGRTRSSRSSTRSFGEYGYGGSDVELSPRHSHDQFHSSRNYYSNSHSRVYSSSSIPPRLSFGDEVLFSGASPGRPLFNKGEIGRAIG